MFLGLRHYTVGPRACVGQHLAWVTMRVLLSNIVHRYTVAAPPGADLAPSVGFTVTPADGARVSLVRT